MELLDSDIALESATGFAVYEYEKPDSFNVNYNVHLVNLFFLLSLGQ